MNRGEKTLAHSDLQPTQRLKELEKDGKQMKAHMFQNLLEFIKCK